MTNFRLSSSRRQKIGHAHNDTLFLGKATSHLATNENLLAEVWKDIDFSTEVFEFFGDFYYDGSKVRYGNPRSAIFSIDLSCSLESDTNNTIIDMGQFKNDTVDPGAMSDIKISSANDVNNLSLNSSFMLDENDYVNAYIKASKDAIVSIYHFQVRLKFLRWA